MILSSALSLDEKSTFIPSFSIWIHKGGLGSQKVFDLVDVTNLSTPDAGHMRRLVLTFTDQDHFTQEWTWREKGREGTVVIHFERKK